MFKSIAQLVELIELCLHMFLMNILQTGLDLLDPVPIMSASPNHVLLMVLIDHQNQYIQRYLYPKTIQSKHVLLFLKKSNFV